MKKIYYAFALLLCVNHLFAQKIDTTDVQRNEKGQISFARIAGNDSTGPKIEDAVSFLKQTLRAKMDDEFSLEKTNDDDIGFIHQRFQQYYKGIKVEGGVYLVHAKNGNVKTINGDFFQVDLPSLTAGLPEAMALVKALTLVGAKKYKWEDELMEKFIKQNTNNPSATYYPKGELVICRDYVKGDNVPKLSWKFTISSLEPNDEEIVFINASTGELVSRKSLICHTNVVGSADTRYTGTKAITADSYSGSYRLRENRSGVDVQTLNMQKGINYGAAIDFTDNDNSWTSAEFNNANQDNAALDVHWGIETVLDYWKNIHGRNSLDGNGLAVKNYVHYGNGFNNAFWDGTNNIMSYGDGDGFTFTPLTALDICAHELGHGINKFTANLDNNTFATESAALNEGFSDIWGATIEAWAAPTKQRWIIGEDISIFGGIRNMSNPNLGIEGNVDTYHGTNWYYGTNGSLYAHINCGVLNYWYYLLTEGGSGTNDISNSFNVFGIGITDAAKIAYRAENNYLTSTANFAAARTATITAATDLFGANSCQVVSVTNAWYAVGVGAAYTVGTLNPYIDGGAPLCTSGTYTINGGTATWSVSGPVSSSPSGNSTTLTATGNGYAYLSASVANACGTSTTGSSSKTVYIGVPTENARVAKVAHPTLCGWQIICTIPDEVTIAQRTPDGGVTWINCNITGNGFGGRQVLFSNFIQGPAPTATYTMRFGTSCGFGNPYTSTVAIPKRNCGPGGGGGGVSTPNSVDSIAATGLIDLGANDKFSVYPNPTSGQLTIVSKANSMLKAIFIYNQVGLMVKSFNYKEGISKTTLDLNGLPSGIYQAKISNGITDEVKKFIIQH